MADQRQQSRSRLPRAKKPRSKDGDPKMIGHWKIGRTIGKGSSGRVKIARHVKTHQYAAIKIVSKTALINSRISMADVPAQAEKVLLSIEREIVIMKLIDHPNVLNLYDVWETAHELYLIMEYVEGGELFDYLVSRGRIPVQEALHYFQQIISAISYCHSFNIAHRDLKPENLLLSGSGASRNIKVADFGMAAYTDPTLLLSTSCGSPHYASPEVVEGRSYKGSISDIWSCGVILYALLVGRLPFDHENLRTLLEKVKLATFEIPLDVPPAARNLISRMLEKDVERRITMAQIQKHPFFLSAAPSPSLILNDQTPTLDELSCQIKKPVHCEEVIDADIFDNLRTLWHGVPAKEIVDGLLSDEKTWEKAVYNLLLNYRSKHLESYNMDEDDDGHHRQQSSPQADTPSTSDRMEQQMECVSHEVVHNEVLLETVEQPLPNVGQHEREEISPASSPRPTAPTPQRATGRRDALPSETKSSEIISTTSVQPIPIRNPTSEANMLMDRLSTTCSPVNRSDDLPQLTLPPLLAIELPTLPMISPQGAAPTAQADVSLHASTLLSPSPILGLPGIVVPNLDNVDETVQRFFHQIVEHLNNMQKWQSTASTRSGSAATPEPGSDDAPNICSSKLYPEDANRIIKERNYIKAPRSSPLATSPSSGADFDPDASRFEDASEESEALSDLARNPGVLGLGFSRYHKGVLKVPGVPRPPLQQHQLPLSGHIAVEYSRKKTSNTTGRSRDGPGDKENRGIRGGIVEADNIQVRKKSSLRRTKDARKTMSDKRVHIVLPSEKAESSSWKAKRESLSPRSAAETSPALSDGSFFLDRTTPRSSWFANLFRFKPACHHLLSVHDAHTTREECARLLREFGVTVLLVDSEGNGTLKCKLDEIKDPAGVMAIAKAVRFRVELHHVTHAHSVSGYVTSLTMVQEKGALSSFKLIFNRLRREWDLDTPPSTRTSSSVY